MIYIFKSSYKLIIAASLLLIIILNSGVVYGVQNFPPPEFEGDYQMPAFELPQKSVNTDPIMDVSFLFIALAAASYFVHKKRSRTALFCLMVVCMLYFGFYRKGCVCPIGAIQNVALGLFDSQYIVSWPVIAFFALPLIFSLFLGRVFCGSVCPLGAIQDLVCIKPLKVPGWLESTLQMVPWLYLCLAILFAATGSAFLICRFDPFISIYRFTATFDMLILSGVFLILSMLIGRPYCRFICPYGILLRQASRLSKWKLSIVPPGEKCIECKLCVQKCPFDAINTPAQAPVKANYSAEIKTAAIYLAITAILVTFSGIGGNKLGKQLAQKHPAVIKAAIVLNEPVSWISDNDRAAIESNINATGESEVSILTDKAAVVSRYATGTMTVFIIIALVAGTKLIRTITYRTRKEYWADSGNCLYCGRCLNSCASPNQ